MYKVVLLLTLFFFPQIVLANLSMDDDSNTQKNIVSTTMHRSEVKTSTLKQSEIDKYYAKLNSYDSVYYEGLKEYFSNFKYSVEILMTKEGLKVVPYWNIRPSHTKKYFRMGDRPHKDYSGLFWAEKMKLNDPRKKFQVTLVMKAEGYEQRMHIISPGRETYSCSVYGGEHKVLDYNAFCVQMTPAREFMFENSKVGNRLPKSFKPGDEIAHFIEIRRFGAESTPVSIKL